MVFQTRSEENGIRFFESASEAFEHALSDETVWKISIAGARLVRREGNRWEYAPLVLGPSNEVGNPYEGRIISITRTSIEVVGEVIIYPKTPDSINEIYDF